MNENVKAGADINAGDGGYRVGTQEEYEKFLAIRNQIRYSTNWMGVANMQWYRDRGLTKTVTQVLEKDSAITDRKAGDVVEFEEITEYYSCGRLDFWNPRNDSGYPEEMGVPPMRSEDWRSFGNWLDTFSSDEVLTLDQLVKLYELTNPKIRWAKQVGGDTVDEKDCERIG